MEKKEQHIDIVNGWIVGYLSSNITKEEHEKLQLWINLSQENREYFLDMQEIWMATSSGRPKFDAKRAYEGFLERVQKSQHENNQQKSVALPKIKAKKSINLRPMWYAAAMSVVAVLGVLFAYRSGQNNIVDRLADVVIKTPVGSSMNIELPDGSSVWLNAGSELRYAQDYGIKSRRVELQGEGLFDVEKSEGLPFSVKSEGIEVEVLGTVFNVKAYADEHLSKVSLLEGSVAVMTPNGSVKLKEDQQVVFNRETERLVVSDIETSRSATWTSGEVHFDEEPLGSIMNSLERAYGVSVSFTNESLKELRFYGSFNLNNQNIEQVLNSLASTGKIDYRVNAKNVIISEL